MFGLIGVGFAEWEGVVSVGFGGVVEGSFLDWIVL